MFMQYNTRQKTVNFAIHCSYATRLKFTVTIEYRILSQATNS